MALVLIQAQPTARHYHAVKLGVHVHVHDNQRFKIVKYTRLPTAFAHLSPLLHVVRPLLLQA